MAVGRIGRVGVRQGARHILGDVQEEVAALGNVQKLHPATDAKDRHPAFGDEPHKRAVKFLATAIHQANRRVEHEPIVARIEIGPADQNKAVQQIEHATDVALVVHGRDDYWHRAGLHD
jgi:predicted trehalose synthase